MLLISLFCAIFDHSDIINCRKTCINYKNICRKTCINYKNICRKTCKYIGEGFDERKLNTLFIVSPFRWNGTLKQYAGRLHRTDENKEEVEVHDYVETALLVEKMYHERLRGYKTYYKPRQESPRTRE